MGQTFCPHDGTRLTPAGLGEVTDPLVGQVLDGRYRVEARVGRGGCGTVYQARQVNVDRDVAVKVLSAEAAADEEMTRRFETEARIISRLHHPNTLKLHDFGYSADGRMYLVTEFLNGAPLDEVLRAGPVSTTRTIQILQAICKSLAEAHEQGVIHRDLKPGNVFLVEVGAQQVVKVLDFGIAKLTEGTTFTAAGKVFGTPAYMSPEQARGEAVDPRSDLYSLGVLAYECLSGSPPFVGTTPMSLLLKHLQETPVPLRDIRPPISIDPQLDALVMGLLAKLPDERPANALAVLDQLGALHTSTGETPTILTSGIERATLSDGLAETADSEPVLAPTLVPTSSEEDFAESPDAASVAMRVGVGLALVAVALVGWLILRPEAIESPSGSPPDAAMPVAVVEVTASPSVAADVGLRDSSVDTTVDAAPDAAEADTAPPAHQPKKKKHPRKKWSAKKPKSEVTIRVRPAVVPKKPKEPESDLFMLPGNSK